MPNTIRVFVSYAHEGMQDRAAALSSSLRRMGATVVGDEPQPGQDLRTYYADAISAAQLMILLLRAGDERRPWIQYETQMMLQACWKNDDSRITVVAPAIGGIPGALRHRDFVQYFAHDDARLDQWSDHDVVDAFTENLLAESASHSMATLDPVSDEEIRSWRNRLVHIGSSSLLDDPAERQRLVDQLRNDLELFDGQPDEEQRERLLDRALLAAHLGAGDLVAEYYRRLTARETPQTDDEDAADENAQGISKISPDTLGLIAYGAGDYERARVLFEKSLRQSDTRYGPDHPITVGILNNLALTHSKLGRAADARELFDAALARSRSILGELHPQTADIAHNLGVLLLDLGQMDQARKTLELAANAYRAVRPADSPELADVLSRIEILGLVGDN